MDQELEKRLDLAGVDRKKALERFMGRDDLYEQFLYRFLVDENTVLAEKALSEGDLKKAEFAVHNLKGISGTLGMDQLYADCAAFMKLMQNGSLSCEKEWFRIKEGYQNLCKVISGKEETL